MSESKTNKRFIFQFLMLLLLLIILPIGTYFWTVEGHGYRKDRINKLESLGKLVDFSVTDLNGEKITLENIDSTMVLTAFLSEDTQKAKSLLARIEKLKYQLEDGLKRRQDLMYLIHVATDSLPSLKYRAEDIEFKSDDQFKLVTASKDYLNKIAKENYKIDISKGSIFDSNILTLVDLQGVVRTHYNAMNNQEMGLLVEHMAIILPKAAKSDIIFERDKEK